MTMDKSAMADLRTPNLRLTISTLETFQGREVDVAILATIKAQDYPTSNFAFQTNRVNHGFHPRPSASGNHRRPSDNLQQ
ncbi:unnamed protein product [Bursaphelenchus okinawaensis]|uniref:DNA2/NAM7 helicase-like C-terminal domain-containing protein n=1 Tax=Bursaphelenchus okinawaensis TaxID=465554 RepID=A0A811JUW0_9BILA|nr:unnamed protein product [Bursaphelenchus okinawaensis]CAG9084184.1 unnamed protein product [Bursaphelenchus okinawaensis]